MILIQVCLVMVSQLLPNTCMLIFTAQIIQFLPFSNLPVYFHPTTYSVVQIEQYP